MCSGRQRASEGTSVSFCDGSVLHLSAHWSHSDEERARSTHQRGDFHGVYRVLFNVTRYDETSPDVVYE